MRIIIDMQGLQTASLVRGHGLGLLALVQDIARNPNNYEVHLLLNGALQQNILDIRHAFSEWVSAQHIHIFEIPLPIASNDSSNSARLDLAKIIYTQLIHGLNPDILLLTQSLSAGWTDNVVTPIQSLNQGITTAVLWLENDKVFFEAASSNNLFYKQWSLDRLNTFATKQNIITSSTDLREELIEKWGAPDRQIITIESQADSENYDVLKLINWLELVSKPKLTIIETIRKQRPRLAYVSPLPPEKTGIADYSAELIPELARYYDIELISDQPEVGLFNQDKKLTIRTVAWFKQNPNYYQRVLYHFGNNWEFHGHMFSLIKEIPGIVVLHDFFLGHVMAAMVTKGRQPQAWSQALFQSHGYQALKQQFQESDILWNYPCNLAVIQDALGVIVHSQNSQRLAREWLSVHADIDWTVIPLLREPAVNIDRNQARHALNWHQDNFVVCSFGFLGPSKLNQRLFEAWLQSTLAKNENCLLVFVGECGGDYGKTLAKTIKSSGLGHRVIITGWTNTSEFRQYLAAGDLAVQLRTLSRGETSAAVLDCMNYGLPTIVNANGSMADLPRDSVWMLPDEFSDNELVEALETLWQDSSQRQRLAALGHKLISTHHKPSQCAEQYALTLETIYQRSANHPKVVVQALAASESLPSDEQSLASLSKILAASFPPKPLPRQLLIDVSSIARHDLKSGIERVVRAQLLELLKNPPPGFRIEPVYLTDQRGTWHYQYARTYTCKILGIDQPILPDAPVDIAMGDVLYVADFYPSGVIEAHKSGLYSKWQARGIEVNFLVYDLLPVKKPECFPSGADIVHKQWLKVISESASRLVCISNAVADELNAWLQSHQPDRKTNLPIKVSHLGADIKASAPSTGRPDHGVQLLTKLSTIPSFIMVGTIEPRKGHLQALAAFELLWKQGLQVNLVIVGKEGWVGLPDKERRTIPKILAKLKNHKEIGQRLFWLEGISDEYLEQMYATCACLIAASEAEGFGLPLIEAAQHQLPIIVRDIPVFKEVVGEHAYYFEGLEAEALSKAIKDWLVLYKQGIAPDSTNIPWLTWEQSAQQLIEQIIPKAINHWK